MRAVSGRELASRNATGLRAVRATCAANGSWTKCEGVSGLYAHAARARAGWLQSGAVARVGVQCQVKGLPQHVFDLAVEAAAIGAGAFGEELMELGGQPQRESS